MYIHVTGKLPTTIIFGVSYIIYPTRGLNNLTLFLPFHIKGNKRGDVHMRGRRQMSSDHLVEMIPPLPTLGREFLTSTAFERKAGDLYRVVGKIFKSR